MNAKQIGWARRYQAALRRHLKQGPKSSLRPALELGRGATVLGLETLDVARIHERALTTLKSSGNANGKIRRAEVFFAEVIIPIEKTHRAALSATRHIQQLAAMLDRRTAGLTASRQRLKLRIAQRKGAENDLRKSGEHSARLLRESRRLQEHLRRLAHRILSAQEHERTRVSRELQDEIAQTLLGINVRLLTLRTGAVAHARGLKKEVASTQKLVRNSETLMRRFARELGIHYET